MKAVKHYIKAYKLFFLLFICIASVSCTPQKKADSTERLFRYLSDYYGIPSDSVNKTYVIDDSVYIKTLGL